MTETTDIRETLNLDENIQKLIAQANEIQSKCSDHVVTAEEITMDDALNLQFNGNILPLSTLATGHICGKLKIPTAYFNRCAELNPELAAENMNAWLAGDQRKFMLRTHEDKIRGVLSGSYSKFDAPEILRSMDEALGFENYKMKGSLINEERLHLRLVEKEMLPIDGEDLFAGITLDSSDVGRSGLYVRFFIYKQVCTNGLVIAKSHGELFRQKHVGITSDEFQKGLVAGLENFGEVKTKMIELINETKSIPTNHDVEDLIEEVKTKTLLSDESVEEVIFLMDNRYGNNRWGMINGITEVAQKFTLDRRLQLEEIAGSMLVR